MGHFDTASVFVLLCVITYIHAISQPQETSFRSQIRQLIIDDAKDNGNANDYRLAAGLIRLAFHDCVGKRCDGCINIKNSENAGLDIYINIIEKLYKTTKVKGKAVLSRADFWALGALEAVQFTSELAICPRCTRVFPKIKFQTGRKDCVGNPKGSPWTNDWHEFPDPLGTTKDTTDFFKKQFGFTNMDTVAILGAHTLGQAHPTASGFSRPWVARKSRFDNEYFQSLLDKSKGWKHVQRGRRRNAKWQWESDPEDGRTFMMLNADMSLVKNLTKVGKDGEVKGCTYNSCKQVNSAVANTVYWVKQFADDNDLFLQKFGRAFQKMISHGYSNLKDVETWIGFG